MGRKPKAVAYEWTEEEEEQLITFWEKNEFLYDMGNKNYKDQHKKDKAYEEIASQIGVTVAVILDRMATLRSMLGAARRKENKAKSGSAPYHPTHRDRIIRAKLGFLEKHIKTRKTVSSLPELPQSQRTDSELFSQDGSMNRDLLQQHLTPGALDAFLSGGLDPNENDMVIEGVEGAESYEIPKIMLVDMPIAEITPDTRIVHLGGPENINERNIQPQTTQYVLPPPPPPPQAGTSGLHLGDAHEAMEVEAAINPTASVAAVTPVTAANMPEGTENVRVKKPQEGKSMTGPTGQPKKGTNTKNKNANRQPPTQAEREDTIVNERMAMLKKITDLMQQSYGARRNEMEVWGHYVGIKAGRIPVGRKRDKVLLRVEELLSEATYDDDDDVNVE